MREIGECGCKLYKRHVLCRSYTVVYMVITPRCMYTDSPIHRKHAYCYPGVSGRVMYEVSRNPFCPSVSTFEINRGLYTNDAVA